MALKMRHWILLALAGCGLIAVTYLPPSKDLGIRRSGNTGMPEARVLNRIRLELKKQQELLALYTARGQILEEVGRLSPQSSGEPTLLFFDADLPDTWQTAMRGAVQIEWDAIQPVESEFRFVLAVVMDTLMRVPGVNSSARLHRRHILPPAMDGHTCLAVVPLLRLTRDDRVPPTFQPAYQSEYLGRNEYLGPCALYLAFGAPGPRIEEWFLSHGYLFAYDSRWTGPESIRPPGSLSRARSLQEAACTHGRRSACLTVMLDSLTIMDATQRRSNLGQLGVTAQSGLGGARISRATGSLLADLLRLKGKARFRAFWTSNLDVESAFAEAMGESLGDWTAKWATRHLEAPDESPRVRLASAVWAILIGAIAAAAGALSFNSREVC